MRRNIAGSRSNYYDDNGIPRLSSKKQRPFSAPRHQGLRSLGLKNKISQQSSDSRQIIRPGT